jgi:hypothetical protein
LHGGMVAYLISPKREFESPFVAINKTDKPTPFPLASQSHIVRDISHEISLNPHYSKITNYSNPERHTKVGNLYIYIYIYISNYI